MKHFLLFVLISGMSVFANAQMYNAVCTGAGESVLLKSSDISVVAEKSRSQQIAGWPKAFSKDEYYMNARGLCLADLDGNGTDEIIFGADTAIYAYKGDGTCLWRVDLQGIAYYPPSCADIDNDGNLEILMYTRAPAGTSTSYFYIFDKNGNIRDGFPKSYASTQIIIGSPVVADFDGDRQMEIIVAKFGSSQSKLYVYEPDGSVRSGFPKNVTGRFAVTPSVGYDSKSGRMVDSLIVLNTTAAIYAFDLNGNVLDGFPVQDNNVKFSYQSPLICHTSEKTVIVGASHGDAPIFYSLETNGQFSEGWPVPTANNAWTYTAPTVGGLGEDFDFYMFTQRESDAAIHAMRPDGSYIDGFPAPRVDAGEGGSEGVTTYMYSTDLEKIYILGTSISIDTLTGEGYVHIFEANPDLSDFHETDESPLRVQGLSFMSAVNLGDVNGNGKLDLVIQSYDQMGEGADSIHISVFETNYDYNPSFMYGTYKGRNDRCGFVTPFSRDATVDDVFSDEIILYPNPANDMISVEINVASDLQIVDLTGKTMFSYIGCSEKCDMDVSGLKPGVYFCRIKNNDKVQTVKFVKL
ncbi:MAG: T9SS type A sorting domain-containing protein [Bacteroidales bacterium]|nr:T9SS type A sorting domain-containing protein [Bacteroidales bacterium]